ncbi:MAG: hypothetical protein M3542_09860 [Acidobacteriota bacterium]|nr:hypothetical protein [Acidobacteriota bacterium]
MYVALTRTVLTDIDRDKVVQEVRKIRLKYPGASDDELAKTVIRQTAIRCAMIGAVASAPPGLLAVVPLAADFSYQVLALNRLVLTIARIYSKPTTREQRAASVAASLALGGGTEFLRRQVVKTVTNFLRRQRAATLVPAFGAVLGGVMSYAAVHTIGRQAQVYYREKRRKRRARAAAAAR